MRLRYAYFITCREFVKDAAGEVVELRCTYDPATKGGNAPDGRKVKATLHWLSAADALPAELRLYNPLFMRASPGIGNFAAEINPSSLEVIADARVEPALAATKFRRRRAVRTPGLFLPRPGFETPQRLVFNRTVGLARYLGEGVQPRLGLYASGRRCIINSSDLRSNLDAPEL